MDTLRLLTEFEVTAEEPKTFEKSVEIYKGETVICYFLINAPADRKLLEAAERVRLTNPGVLGLQAGKLINESRSHKFVMRFTAQWLGLTDLDDIMPDPRLLNFNDNERRSHPGDGEVRQ